MKKLAFTIGFILLFLMVSIALYQNYVTMNNAPSSPDGEIEKISSDSNPQAIEILASNLQIPWSLDFLPASQNDKANSDILFTQRPGILSLLSNGSVSTVAEIEDVEAIGEGGLMGLTIHPDFSNNQFIYLMYTYSAKEDNTLNRVVRYKYSEGTITDKEIIVDRIPGARFHNGGRIKFGPDEFLYITTGDSQEPSLAQNRDSLAGKILRVKDDGSPAPGNPFNSRIYSYGHRNPQGLTWDSSGNLYSTEHGRSNPTGYDEVNLIEAGKNYGWPEIEGNEVRNNLVTPLANSGLGTWAPGSAAFYNKSLFFGGLRGAALFELKLENEKTILVEHFLNEFGRIRDAVIGPDNMIYITTSNRDGRGDPTTEDDRIIRIDPDQLQ